MTRLAKDAVEHEWGRGSTEMVEVPLPMRWATQRAMNRHFNAVVLEWFVKMSLAMVRGDDKKTAELARWLTANDWGLIGLVLSPDSWLGLGFEGDVGLAVRASNLASSDVLTFANGNLGLEAVLATRLRLPLAAWGVSMDPVELFNRVSSASEHGIVDALANAVRIARSDLELRYLNGIPSEAVVRVYLAKLSLPELRKLSWCRLIDAAAVVDGVLR